MAKRGLAQVQDPEKRREIARKGGMASHGGGRPARSRKGGSQSRKASE